jgi:hypothetical protein
MKSCAQIFLFAAVVAGGCATPPEVKQAVANEDAAYSNNLKLMQQYQHIEQQIESRRQLWYQYVETRDKFNLALEWIVSDPQPKAAVSDPVYVDVVLDALGDELVGEVNKYRFGGLAARPGSKVGSGFGAGDGKHNMTELVSEVPKLVRLARAKATAELTQISIDPKPFQDYAVNVASLQQINAMVQRYLNTDVTVSSQDVQDIADAIKQKK